MARIFAHILALAVLCLSAAPAPALGAPTAKPTSAKPTKMPTNAPIPRSTREPTPLPTGRPTGRPTSIPTSHPTKRPTAKPIPVNPGGGASSSASGSGDQTQIVAIVVPVWVVFCLCAGVGYWYYKRLQKKIAEADAQAGDYVVTSEESGYEDEAGVTKYMEADDGAVVNPLQMAGTESGGASAGIGDDEEFLADEDLL